MHCGCLGLFGLEGGFQGLHGVMVVFSMVYSFVFADMPGEPSENSVVHQTV